MNACGLLMLMKCCSSVQIKINNVIVCITMMTTSSLYLSQLCTNPDVCMCGMMVTIDGQWSSQPHHLMSSSQAFASLRLTNHACYVPVAASGQTTWPVTWWNERFLGWDATCHDTLNSAAAELDKTWKYFKWWRHLYQHWHSLATETSSFKMYFITYKACWMLFINSMLGMF